MDERKIEHVHHASVEPSGVAEEFAVEDAVDDVSQCTGDDECDGCDIACFRLLFIDQRVDISSQQTDRDEPEEGQG